MKKYLFLIVIPIFLVILFVFPLYKVEVVPELKLQAVDREGKFVSNISVTQEWCHHSIESWYHTDEQTSDEQGYVVFTKKEIRTNLISILRGKLIDQISFINPHANSGRFASFAVKNFGSYTPLYRDDSELPSKIIVYR